MAEEQQGGFDLGGALQGLAIGLGGGLAGKDMVTPWLAERRESRKASKIRDGRRALAEFYVKNAAPGTLDKIAIDVPKDVTLTPELVIDAAANLDDASFSAWGQEFRRMNAEAAAETKDDAKIDAAADLNAKGLTQYLVAEGAPIPPEWGDLPVRERAVRLEALKSSWDVSINRSASHREVALGGIRNAAMSVAALSDAAILGTGTVDIENSIAELEKTADDLHQVDAHAVRTAAHIARQSLMGAIREAGTRQLKHKFEQGIFDDRTTVANGGIKVQLDDDHAAAAGINDHVARLEKVRLALTAATDSGVTLDGPEGEMQQRIKDLGGVPLGEMKPEDRWAVMNGLHRLGGPDTVALKTNTKMVETSKKEAQGFVLGALEANRVTFDSTRLGDFLQSESNWQKDPSGRWTTLSDQGALTLATLIDDRELNGAAASEAYANRIIAGMPMSESAATQFRTSVVARGAARGSVIASNGTSANPIVNAAHLPNNLSPEEAAADVADTSALIGAVNEFDQIWEAFGPVVMGGSFTQRNRFDRPNLMPAAWAQAAGLADIRRFQNPVPESPKERDEFLSRIVAGGEEVLEKALARATTRRQEAKIREWYSLANKARSALATSGSTIDTSGLAGNVRGLIFHTVHPTTQLQELSKYDQQLAELEVQAASGVVDKTILAGIATEIQGQRDALDSERKSGFSAAFREQVIKDVLLAWSFEEDWSEEAATERLASFSGGNTLDVGKMMRGQSKLMKDLEAAETPIARLGIIEGWLRLNPDALLAGGPLPGGEKGEIRYGMLIKDIDAMRSMLLSYGEAATDEALGNLGWAEGFDTKKYNDFQNRGLWFVYKALQQQ